MAATRTHGPRDTRPARSARKLRRLARVAEARRLRAIGLSWDQIASEMDLLARTVRGYLEVRP